MARLRGCLPFLAFLVFFTSCVEGTHLQRCHRVFPLQLTAAAMPCRYICAHYYGYGPHYLVRGEDDGTLCQKHGKTGVCWNGECLTRYGEADQWSQQADATSKVPLRIRKRDVSTTTKEASITKTMESNGGSSITTKGVHVVKTVKSNGGSGGTKSATDAGLQGSYITSFGTQTSSSTKNGMSSGSNVDVDPFAIKNTPSGSHTTDAFVSRGITSPDISRTLKNGGIKFTVRHGPNGETIKTRTVRKYIITKGPTKTVRRIIIQQGSTGGASNLIHGGNRLATKTVKVSFNRGSTGGTNGHIIGGQTGVIRKTSQITTDRTTSGTRRNPIASIVHTIKQQRISGGQNVGGASTATKTVSTVAVTKSVRPSLSVQVTKQVLPPLVAASPGTSNGATLTGVEVEAPGYTAGLRHNWKWVLARRVGVYPPYVQALDPDVLFYKLGLQKPSLPSVPGAVLNILNRVPVHPVGSDIYGYLLSRKILEKIRGFTDGVNGLTKLTTLLSTTNTSNQDNSNLLNGLFTGTGSAQSGSTFLTKLLLASLSATGGNPIKSPYGSLFGPSYAAPFGSTWPTFPAGQFSPGSWPLYSRGPLGPFSPFGSYDSLGSTKSSTGVKYTLSEDGEVVPSIATRSPENAESLLSDSNYIKSILTPAITRSYRTERKYGLPNDESLEPTSEKLAHALGVEKLRRLLKIPSEQDSPVRRILKRLYRQDHDNVPTVLRRLGLRPHTRLYNKIMRQIVWRRKHDDTFSPSKSTTSYSEVPDKTEDLISELRDLRGKTNYGTIRYLRSLSRSEPGLLESLDSTTDGPEGSNDKLRALVQFLLERKHHLRSARPRSSFSSSGTNEEIDAILDYPRRHQSPDRESELSKQITKALLTSRQGPISTEGNRDEHLSKLVSVQGSSHTEKRPQGLSESRVLSTTYHSTKVPATVAIPMSPATASALEVTRQITQGPQPGAPLGMNGFSTTSSSPSLLQPFAQFTSQPLYLTGGNGFSNQAALSNQFVSSTGSMYGRPLDQPTAAMMTGTAGYTGYATMPTSTAYLSQYAPQPYYVGTSLYGSHPHYIVEGHEAPGTRWQLRVWRHHPGVSYAAPGYNGFQSSHLGSVVTRARETVTRGMHLGSQPGQFGFTTYGSTVPGSNTVGATSQYVVKASDGNIDLSRQPLLLGSPTQAAPASSVVVSQITKQTTKTTTGTPVSTLSGGLSSSSFQSAVEGGSFGGTTKSDSLSDLTQSKESNLFRSTASGSASENTESLFSTAGSSSNSLQSEGDVSQSKLRR